MLKLRNVAVLLATALAMPLCAQDFGYPKEKAFYKAHWDDIVADQEGDNSSFARYALQDFDHDGWAELYVFLWNKNEYLYTKKGNKAVRVSETQRPVEDLFSLDSFVPYYLAPCYMLQDKPMPEFESMEQHFYDRYEFPNVWFGLHPKVEAFNLKNALNALVVCDSEFISDALSIMAGGHYDKSDVKNVVIDAANGYASVEFKTENKNFVECCYWNLANGGKLLAVHYLLNGHDEDPEGPFEQILFMKYDSKTKRMNPIVAPIKNFDFQMEFHFELPRKGKDIHLTGFTSMPMILKWNGNGFDYKIDED